MSKVVNKSKTDKKLSPRRTSAASTPVPLATGNTDQDWNCVIERETSEDVIQEIVQEVLSGVDHLVLHRYVQKNAFNRAVEKVKNDIMHMCEWLYAKRDVEVEKCYFEDLDDKEPVTLDMDSLGSGCLPSLSSQVVNVCEPHSSPAMGMCQNATATNICAPMEIFQSFTITNFEESLADTQQGKKLKEKLEWQSNKPDKQIISSEPSVGEVSDHKADARPLKLESLPFPQAISTVECTKYPAMPFESVTNLAGDHDVNGSNEVQPPAPCKQKKLSRRKSQSFERRVPVNYTVKGQLSHNQTIKDVTTFKEIMVYSKMNTKKTSVEVNAFQPRPTTIDSIKLSEGVTIYHLDKLKTNPLQMKEINQEAIKMEKSKALQPISSCRKGIIEPTLSTHIKANALPQPLTLPPITRKKNPKTLC